MVLPKSMMTISVSEAKQIYSLLQPFQSNSRYIPRSFNSKLFWEIVKRVYTSPAGIPGSGVGKGGGGGGSVRQSGGGLGKYGAAQEEGYFHHKQREQLEKLKKQLKDNPALTQKKDK